MRSPCASGSLAGRNASASKRLPAPPVAAGGGDVDEVVLVGLQRRFADDVEVGDDVALRGDEEARADRGLAGAALQHGADLHQLRARLLVDLARRQGYRRARST